MQSKSLLILATIAIFSIVIVNVTLAKPSDMQISSGGQHIGSATNKSRNFVINLYANVINLSSDQTNGGKPSMDVAATNDVSTPATLLYASSFLNSAIIQNTSKTDTLKYFRDHKEPGSEPGANFNMADHNDNIGDNDNVAATENEHGAAPDALNTGLDTNTAYVTIQEMNDGMGPPNCPMNYKIRHEYQEMMDKKFKLTWRFC